MTSTTIRTMRLQRGQALHVALDAGSTLQVAAGAVRLREPMRWLGGTVVAPTLPLEEGQCHHLAQGGWYALEALGDGVELLQHLPPSRWQWMRRMVRRAAAPA